MSFSKPSEATQSPVEAYIDLQMRDGHIRVRDNATKERTVIESGKITAIILEADAASYGGWKPDGDHLWSNHFRTRPSAQCNCVVRGQKTNKIYLEGNPNSSTFREKAKATAQLSYRQLVFVNYAGQLCALRIKGTALASWILAKKEQGGTVDRMAVTISPGAKKIVNNQEVVEFNFDFEPVAADEELFNQCVEMDTKVQEWLDRECQTGMGETEPKAEVEPEVEPSTAEIVGEDNIDDDF